MQPEGYTMLVKFFLRIYIRCRTLTVQSLFCSIILLLLIFISCSKSTKNTRGEWQTVLKGDWNAHLNDVFFISETHGWSVGNSTGLLPDYIRDEQNQEYHDGTESTILHTNNGGEDWTRQNSGIYGKPLKKIYFQNVREGWCVGEEGVVIHTIDGGKNWKQIETGIQDNLHSLFFTENIGWIVGDWATILKSTDNGLTFNVVDGSEFARKSLKDIFFTDNLNGWIITYSNPDERNTLGYVYNTTDGGKTWNEQFSTKPALFSIKFIDRNNGWVVGDQRSIYYTSDSGKSWKSITDDSNRRHKEEYGQPEYLGNEPLHTFTLYDIDFITAQHGWIVGDLGVILHTSDREQKKENIIWKHQRGGPRFHNSADGLLLAVDFITKKQGWAVGENGTILRTRNGGLTWEAQSSPTHLLYDVCLINEHAAIAVGDRGAVLRSEDAGTTWQVQDSRTAECFGATHFVSKDEGWAVAEAGVILHTTNAGAVWQPQVSNTQQDLLTVFFIDDKNGWAAGSAGEIVSTSDGGKTWSKQQSGVSVNLFDIHFTSKNEGWIVGLFGTLLFTKDGGKMWMLSSLSHQLAKDNSGGNIWLNAVYFVSSELGWVVGTDGSIFNTIDGGKKWSRQQSHTKNFLYDVTFISKEEGWVVGKDGLVLHTKDGGENWRPQRTDTRTDLTSIQMSEKYSGLITGQAGTILKYEVVDFK